jgi:hypothetical protein
MYPESGAVNSAADTNLVLRFNREVEIAKGFRLALVPVAGPPVVIDADSALCAGNVMLARLGDGVFLVSGMEYAAKLSAGSVVSADVSKSRWRR